MSARWQMQGKKVVPEINTKRNGTVKRKLDIATTKRVTLLFLFSYRDSRINANDNEARSDRYLSDRVGDWNLPFFYRVDEIQRGDGEERTETRVRLTPSKANEQPSNFYLVATWKSFYLLASSRH